MAEREQLAMEDCSGLHAPSRRQDPETATAAGDAERAIRAMQSRPRLQEAIRAAVSGNIETYRSNGLLNRVINDRGRAVGSLIALYLHFSAWPGGKGGLTIGRFQALCADVKICSPGRARALLMLMRFAGYLAPEPAASDRRQRRLVPTEHLIEVHRRRWKQQFEAMALVMPEGHAALDIHGRPEFLAAFVRHLGASYIAGFRVVDYAPDLARLVESNAGLLVISSLFLAAADGPAAPGGTVVPVSISALSATFSIARAHARKLLADAAAAGLVRRTDRNDAVVVLPRLIRTMSDFYAALFALLAHCADAAAAEIGSVPQSARLGRAQGSASPPPDDPVTWPRRCQAWKPTPLALASRDGESAASG
ncbi:MAG: hypothetical protein JO157_01195 [Acetobacteraceae bacterium]|nr:hypothetical protein [Acetobacteraceae bacterium]